MTNYTTCPHCLKQTTARKARAHQRACPCRPMSVRELADLALSMAETCDISFCPEGWLEGQLVSLAHQKGREAYSSDAKQAVQVAVQEYYLKIGIAPSDLPQFGEQS